MASVKFLIQSKKSPANIYVQISLGRGKVYKRKTLFEVNTDDWSNKKNMPVIKNEELENLSFNLDDLKTFLSRKINNDVRNNITIDGNWVENKIYEYHNLIIPKETKENLVTEHIQYIIDNAHKIRKSNNEIGLSISRIKSYKTLKNTILKYEKECNQNKALSLAEITYEFGENFKDWLFDKDYRVNYVGKNIDNLKAVCNDAKKRRRNVSEDFHLMTTVTEKKEDEAIIYLSPEEQEKISKTFFAKEHLENAKKWLLLGCQLGQRFGDLIKIKETNIKELQGRKIIELRQTKTKKSVVIPVLPEAEIILNNGIPTPLPIQKANKYFKEILKKAEIETPVKGYKHDDEKGKNVYAYYPKHELISTHACRRSFATNFYGKIPTPILMNITGHGSEKMFLKYIGKNSYDYAHQMLDYLDKM